jgi:lipopolysaccharide export system permease protein
MFIASLVVSLVALYFGSFLIPYSNQKRVLMERTKIDKLPPIDYQNRNNVFYIGEGGRMYYIGYYDGKNKILRDIVIQEFGNGTLLKRTDAKNGAWDSKTKQWKFKDGFVRFFEDEKEKEKIVAFTDTVFSYLTEKPEDFSREEKEPENMTYPELVDYIRRIKRSGDDASKELTELYLRISFPLANFIIVLFGAPISSSGGGRRGGAAIGFGISLLTSFIFYGCIKTGQSLGHSGKLDPILSAWLANVVFGIGGIIALIKAKK